MGRLRSPVSRRGRSGTLRWPQLSSLCPLRRWRYAPSPPNCRYDGRATIGRRSLVALAFDRSIAPGDDGTVLCLLRHIRSGANKKSPAGPGTGRGLSGGADALCSAWGKRSGEVKRKVGTAIVALASRRPAAATRHATERRSEASATATCLVQSVRPSPQARRRSRECAVLASLCASYGPARECCARAAGSALLLRVAPSACDRVPCDAMVTPESGSAFRQRKAPPKRGRGRLIMVLNRPDCTRHASHFPRDRAAHNQEASPAGAAPPGGGGTPV